MTSLGVAPGPLSSDELLELVGGFGSYQKRALAITCLIGLSFGVLQSEYIFSSYKIPYRCKIPECDETNTTLHPAWLANAVPSASNEYDTCQRYASLTNATQTEAPCSNHGWCSQNISAEICPANLFDTQQTEQCKSYVYGKTNSLVYDFGLECQEWKRALIGTYRNTGKMIALLLSGFVADYFGRKVTLIFSVGANCIIGIIRSFSMNYEMYIVLTLLEGLFGGSMFHTGYMSLTEVIGLENRSRVIFSGGSYCLGQALTAVLAWIAGEWRMFMLVVYVPQLLWLFFVYFGIFESFRWLLTRGRAKEAIKVLGNIARTNKKDVSMEHLTKSIEARIAYDAATKTNNPIKSQNVFMDVIRSPELLKRMCIVPFWWLTTSMIINGLQLTSVALSGDMYLNYFLVNISGVFGQTSASLSIPRIGRKWTAFCGFFICSICLLATILVPQGWLSLVFSMAGKLFNSVSTASVYLYTAELIHTKHRQTLSGYCSMISRFGSIFGTLTPVLATYWRHLPSVVFSSGALLAALLMLPMPDTSRTSMPDTITDFGEKPTKEEHCNNSSKNP